MTAAAFSLLAAAETEEHVVDIGMPALAYGLVTFAILMLLLLGTLVFGKGRS